MKKLVKILAAILVLVGVAVYLAWNPVAERIAQNALKEIASKNKNIGWKGLKVSGSSVSVDSIEGWMPVKAHGSRFAVPIPFQLQSFVTRLPVLSLLTGSPKGEFSLKAYGGSINGDIEDLKTIPKLTLNVQGLKLFEYPILQGFGVTSGTLDATTKALTLETAQPPAGSFTLQVKELLVPQLPIALTKIPIPALPDVSLSAQGALSNQAGNHTTVVDSISLTTHLLTAKGDLRFTMPSTAGNGTCEGEFKVALSEQGVSVLGSAITLGSALANSPLPPGTQRFTLRITGTQAMRGCQLPKLPIGGWCVTARYSST